MLRNQGIRKTIGRDSGYGEYQGNSFPLNSRVYFTHKERSKKNTLSIWLSQKGEKEITEGGKGDNIILLLYNPLFQYMAAARYNKTIKILAASVNF